MTVARDRLIVALDCDADEALRLADELSGVVSWLKVGMTLFYREGPSIVTTLKERGFEVFLDLKLHDIPHQVRGAASAVASLGAKMLTVHASGGEAMMRAALEGARAGAAAAGTQPPAVIAVTVLTSLSDADLAVTGVASSSADHVERLAALALGAGLDGLVCSPLEASALRALARPESLIVTPGVRPLWADAGDQSRVLTPAQALSAGASHLVIGRPITGDIDPAAAASRILAEMEDPA